MIATIGIDGYQNIVDGGYELFGVLCDAQLCQDQGVKRSDKLTATAFQISFQKGPAVNS